MKIFSKLLAAVLAAAFVFIGCSNDSTSDNETPPGVNAPDFTVTITEANIIKLTVTFNNDCDVHNFAFYRNTTSDKSTKELLFSTSTEKNTYTLEDTTVTTSGTYYYWACETVNNVESPLTASAPVEFNYIEFSKPLNFTASCENGIITATWDPPAIGRVHNYQICIKNSENTEWINLKYVTSTNITISYEDAPLHYDVLKSTGFKDLIVRAVSITGTKSPDSDKATVYYEYATMDTVPTNLKGSLNSADPDIIDLSWDSVTNASKYKIYIYGDDRMYDSVGMYSWRDFGETSQNSFKLSRSELQTKSNYKYHAVAVTAIDEKDEESPYSSLLKIEIVSPVITSGTYANGDISLMWGSTTFSAAKNYNIYVSATYKFDDAVKVKTVDGDTNTVSINYSDNPADSDILLTTGSKYIFITAENDLGLSASPESYKKVDNYLILPAISKINSSLDSSKSVISLDWDAPAFGNATEYDIYIRGSMGGYALDSYKYIKTVYTNSATLSSNDTTEDNTILADTEYNNNVYFAIKAKNDAGVSSDFPSYPANGRNPNPCYVSGYVSHPAPQNTKLSFNESNKLVLIWDAVGNADHYIVCYTCDDYSFETAKITDATEDYSATEVKENSVILSNSIFSSYYSNKKYVSYCVKAVDANGVKSKISTSTECVRKELLSIEDLSNTDTKDLRSQTESIVSNYGARVYSYRVTKDQNYEIKWAADGDYSDSYYGNYLTGTMAPVAVTSFYASDMNNFIVNNKNYGCKTPVDFTATEDGYVIIIVASRGTSYGGYKLGIYPVE